MPRAVQLNDGRILRAQGDIPDAAFDKVADGVEAGSQPPSGFTIEGPAYQPPNLAGGEPTDEKSALRRGYEAMSGPAATVRDVTTQAVGQAVQGVAAMAPEAMSLQDQLQQAGVPREAAAQALAQQIVPQTPDQLVSTLALAALGPVGGAAGAFYRTTVPTLLGIGTRYAMDDPSHGPMDGPTLLGQIVGSVVGEGAGPALSQIAKRKMLRVQQDKLGDEFAKVIGEGVERTTSVKNMRTPDNFMMMLGDGKPHESLYWQQASKHIDDAENEITHTIIPAMTQMPAAERQTIAEMLRDAAGFEQSRGPVRPGRPPEIPPTPRPADVLFKDALEVKRRLRQNASRLEGQESLDAWDLHAVQSEKIRSSLAAINPELADQYKAMNDQYTADMAIGNILWRMKEADAWTSGHDRAHFNAPEAASVLKDVMGVSKKTGFMGGPEKIMDFLSGPSGVPGAMPMAHEGVLRMFMQLIQGAPSVSAGGKSRMVTVPTAPVMSSHAKALSDYLATDLIRSMAEKATGAGGQP